MSHEHPPISFFHNQKDSDFDPETGIIHSPGSKGHIRHEAHKDMTKNAKEIGESSDLEKQIENTLKLIDTIELNPLFANDAEQQALLKKSQIIAKNKIAAVLNDISHYMTAIHHLDNVKIEKDRYDQKISLNQILEADSNRKRKHNTLIQSVHSAIKFISHNFGEISASAIEQWEEEEEEKGRTILQAKRTKFPENVICPDGMDIRNRKQIMKWASQLAYSIEKLKKELSY